MVDLKNKRIGIVLSGGGAKGAYQVGMLRALEEMGMQKEHLVLAGTSIGAMNALFYAIRDVDAIRNLLVKFGAGWADVERTPEHVLKEARQDVLEGKVSLADFATKERYRAVSSMYLYQYFSEELSDQQLMDNQIPIRICAYSLNEERPKYYHLRGIDPAWQRKLTIASGSLPFVFEPIDYHGEYLLDGGVVPTICQKNPQPSDKIPVCMMEEEELDLLIISYLKPEDKVDLSNIKKAKQIIELWPREPLELAPGMGTMDFSDEALTHHEKLGYTETINTFTQMDK